MNKPTSGAVSSSLTDVREVAPTVPSAVERREILRPLHQPALSREPLPLYLIACALRLLDLVPAKKRE